MTFTTQAIGLINKFNNKVGGVVIKVDENVRSHSQDILEKSKEGDGVTQIAKNESMKVIENEISGENFNDIQVEDLEALITTIDGIKSYDNQHQGHYSVGAAAGHGIAG